MRNNQLRLAVRGALAAGAFATAAAAPTAFAQEEAADLERVQVTGSRIKRTDIEGALPVTVIDRETIELSGELNVADLLRNQPINSGGSFRPRSGSTGQSWAGLSLRALGEGRTLILIDGRRAPIAPNIGSAQDLNAIPLAAVERIEILSDGASAIYGTDAIGGVVNIITRKDFTGAELSYGEGNPTREGGDTQFGSAIFGASSANGQIMAGMNYSKRDIVWQRDREWSRGGASTFSNNFWTIPAGEGRANVAGCTGPGFVVNEAADTCTYDFTLQAADEAEIENTSVFSRARYDINLDWSVYGNFGVSRVQSFGRYAPVPSSPWLVTPSLLIELPVGSPNHPATAPADGGLNPFWENYGDFADVTVGLRHRFAANGPRDTSTDANVYDFDVGVQGRIADFDVEAGVRRTDSQYYEIGRNYIVSALAQPTIASGEYNIYDPFGAPQDVLQSFTSTLIRDARFVSREFYALASTDLFEMDAGAVSVAFGGEYRDEDYRDIYDDLSANGNITGSSGSSAFGSRDSTAFFAEVLVPVFDNFEITGALRYDDYSDFGSATSPKLAFRWQPLDELTVRGSWGQGFRAPPLDILAAQPSFSADSVRDPDTCIAFGLAANCQTQITGFVIANPNLLAEESDQFSFGVAFEPLEWLNGSIDYWSIEIDDRVAGIGAQTIVNCLLGTTSNCPPGLSNLDPAGTPPIPSAGLGVARSPTTNEIVYLQRGFASLGTVETSGLDLALRTNFDFGAAGRLTNELITTYTLDYKIDGGDDLVGTNGLPDYRAILRNVYTWGDFSVAWNINHIASNEAATAGFGDLPSHTTHDLQVNYFAAWNGRITLGVDNIGDKDPVLDPADGSGRGYNVSLYDPYGRIVYARYTQSF
jgi:iron complex outermembrane receptor protein